jgi:hypothetical protein
MYKKISANYPYTVVCAAELNNSPRALQPCQNAAVGLHPPLPSGTQKSQLLPHFGGFANRSDPSAFTPAGALAPGDCSAFVNVWSTNGVLSAAPSVGCAAPSPFFGHCCAAAATL